MYIFVLSIKFNNNKILLMKKNPHIWTEEEIQKLRKLYPEKGIYACMEALPNLTREQIKGKIDRLKIKSNRYQKWTKDQDELLKEAWKSYSMEDLLKTFPTRDYTSLMNRAKQLGVRCERDRRRLGELNFLDFENLCKESAYWWGFIMADGHLAIDNTLVIQLSKDDEDFLQKLANRLKCSLHDVESINGFTGKPTRYSKLNIRDKQRLIKYKEILKMENTAKTYFPPDLSIFMTEEFLLPFFIGFTDGDGCIWLTNKGTWPELKIELHKSWINNLTLISQKLKEFYNITATVKISKKDTAVLSITKKECFTKLKENLNNLDYMHRKWDKIFDHC